MQANANSAALSSTQASGNQRKKSLSFLIEINVSTSRDSYRTTASSHRLGFSPEKSSFPFLWTQTLHPQARFHKSGPQTPTQNQSLFLGLRCYMSTHKNIQKIASLSQKEVLSSPEEREHISPRLTHLVHPLGCRAPRLGLLAGWYLGYAMLGSPKQPQPCRKVTLKISRHF